MIKSRETQFINFKIAGNNFPFSLKLNLSINPHAVIVKHIIYAPDTIPAGADFLFFIRTPMIVERNNILTNLTLTTTNTQLETYFKVSDTFSDIKFSIDRMVNNNFILVDNASLFMDGDLSICLEFIEYEISGLQKTLILPPTEIPKIYQSNIITNPKNTIGIF